MIQALWIDYEPINNHCYVKLMNQFFVPDVCREWNEKILNIINFNKAQCMVSGNNRELRIKAQFIPNLPKA